MRIEFRYGKKIQQAREARAWTQEQLAIVAGVEPRTIQRVERDQTKNPETLQAIAAAFDLELDGLRSKWRVAESHLVGAWLVTTFREFVDVQEAHPWHMSSRSVVAPLTEEGWEQVDECVKQIFADRECFDPHETDLWDCYLQQIKEPLRSLFEMGLAIFIMDEHRDLLLPSVGDLKPSSDHMECRVQHFWVVPRHGCFRPSDAAPLHSFNASCRAACEVLYGTTKSENGLHIFANALWAAMPPRSEASVHWCDNCFPTASSGGHLTLEYIERVTGLKRFQIDAVCDAITGQPFVEGLA